MSFELPSLETQQQIASILSAYADLIENNTRRIAILEEMARALYQEWFVHFRFPGHEHVPLVSSPLGPIPEGWEVKLLKSVAEVNARSVKKGGEPETICYVDNASVAPGRIAAMKRLLFTEAPGRARRMVRNGDIIWSMVRPNRRSYALLIDPPTDMIVSTGFAVVSATGVPASYLYHSVTTDAFVGYLVNHTRGAAYPAVAQSDFEDAKLVVPPDQLLEQFAAVVDPMLRQRHLLRLKNDNLRTTRDLLLPKLISGEIDVSTLSQEPIAEAAD